MLRYLSKNGGTITTDGTSAGYDMVATEDVTIYPESRKLVSTGIHLEIPEGYFGLLTHRSSLPHKKTGSLYLGILDSEYRGEVFANVYNHSIYRCLKIKKGERFCQVVIIKCSHLELEEVEELGETSRGEGGFGSSGV